MKVLQNTPQCLSPLRKSKGGKKRLKEEGTFACPLLHGWRLIVYRWKQDHVSEQDNKAKRPAKRLERADWMILSAFLLSVCAHRRLRVFVSVWCGSQDIQGRGQYVTLWLYYIDPETLPCTVAGLPLDHTHTIEHSRLMPAEGRRCNCKINISKAQSHMFHAINACRCSPSWRRTKLKPTNVVQCVKVTLMYWLWRCMNVESHLGVFACVSEWMCVFVYLDSSRVSVLSSALPILSKEQMWETVRVWQCISCVYVCACTERADT